MPETTTWKQVAAVIGAFVVVVAGVEAVETLVEKGPTAVKLIAPWVILAVGIYCGSILLLMIWREWRERESARRQKRLSEIKSMKGLAESVVRLAHGCFGPERNREVGPSDLEQAIERLTEILVLASIYEFRVRLYEEVACLRRHVSSGDWSKIKPCLDDFDRWITFAEQDLNQGRPRRISDPLAPRSLRGE